MKQMNKVALALALCVSTPVAFGWTIEFQPNTYGKQYRVLTFKRVRYFEEMERGSFILGKVNEAFLEVLPLLPAAVGVVSDVSGAAKGAAKETQTLTKDSKEGSPAELVSKKAGEMVLALSAPEFAIAQKSIEAGSKFFTEVFEKGLIKNPTDFVIKESKTTDFISDFRPDHYHKFVCRDAKSLKEDHTIKAHRVSENQDILYVIYDRNNAQIMAAGLGPAYGSFTFELIDVENEANPAETFKLGYLKKISSAGGKTCPARFGKIE